jgi:hypothetical protein
MAQNRTFKFYGLGYGATPVTVTATINSTQVFSGEIPTADVSTSVQPTPSPTEQELLFSIDNSALLNTDFAGSLPMTIVVTGGSGVVFGEVLSNYYQGNLLSDSSAGTSTGYSLCYSGNPVNSEGTGDTRSSVAIDGITQVPPLAVSLGCWNWYITNGSTMTYNWNISIGQVANVSGNVTNYSGPFTTTAPTISS